ncbi:MAG: YbhN family protein [Polyangiales bacterium]
MQPEGDASPSASTARWRRYLPLLGLLLLAWVLSRFDLRALGQALARVQLRYVLEALLLFSANMLLKSLRWQRMLAVQGLHLPTKVAVAAFLSSQFYGQVTLGRVGELYRAEALIERGVPWGTALSSCVYDRVLDLVTVLLLGAGLSALVVGNLQAALAAAGCVLALIALGLALLRARSFAALPGVAPLRAFLERRRGTRGLFGLLAQLVAGLGPLLRPGFVLEAMAWTLAGWAGYFASLFVLAAGMGIQASRVSLTAGASLGALSALLPVTLSGLGAREVIFMQVLGLEHVPGPRAVVLSLLHFAVMTATAIGFGLIGLLARHAQQRAYAREQGRRS